MIYPKHNPNVYSAKAIALALAWVARSQGRWCALVAYSGNSGHRLLPLPPAQWDEVAVLDWLEAFQGGGSHRDVPVVEMPEFYREFGAPAGITDVVFITDAQCSLTPEEKAAFNAWKKSVTARLISLVIDSDGGDLKDISDEVHVVPNLSPENEAIGSVLSL